MKPGSRKPKVLIVDDDGDIRNFIRYCLESLTQCDMAGGGEAALEKFTAAMRSREPYDLVLLDILMPGLNGRQVLEKLRNLESAAGKEYLEGVKVVMLTALDDTGNVLQSFKHGCDSYLVKPFDENDL
ncbi:MAG: response regulator, partial [Candidatus Firestonebacteria bacterium]|nr:response regulator [Candidatus Firestonebacteria bacterium]